MQDLWSRVVEGIFLGQVLLLYAVAVISRIHDLWSTVLVDIVFLKIIENCILAVSCKPFVLNNSLNH